MLRLLRYGLPGHRASGGRQARLTLGHLPTIQYRPREIPIASILFAGSIVIFDLLTILSGTALPAGYLLSDVVQAIGFLLVAWPVWRRIGPASLVPWLWVFAVVLNGSATSYQFSLSPGGPSFGVLVLAAAVYGSLTLKWAPFAVSAVVLLIITSTAFISSDPDNAASWIITYLTALGASAALLFARLRSSVDVALLTEELKRAARRDPLTGLLNRHGLEETAPLLISGAERSGQPLHAVFIDIADLGNVNNTYGHQVGDLVLERTAGAMQRASRAGDLLARWGGDEFLILGMGADLDISEFEARLTEQLDMDGFTGRWTGELHVGIAVDHLEGMDDLIRRADEHMYERRAHR